MDEQMRNVNLSVNEINECLEKLIDDHGGEHFEPECPACTAFKKLAAALSQPAAQGDSVHSAGGECGGVQVPLTDSQAYAISAPIFSGGNRHPRAELELVRAIEAAHGIKATP